MKPLPLVVPRVRRARPDRLVGVGLNLYDVMAVDRAAPAGPAAVRARDRSTTPWRPDRHRTIAATRSSSSFRRSRAASRPRLPFYDCQTDDARLVLTVLAEAERFGAVCANRLDVVGAASRRTAARAASRAGRSDGETFLGPGRERRQRHRRVGRPPAPGRAARRGRGAAIRPSRGTHITFRARHLPLVVGAIVPAGGGRTIFALPWLGGTLIGTTDNDYDETDLDHVPPAVEDIEYLLEAANEFFGTELTQPTSPAPTPACGR